MSTSPMAQPDRARFVDRLRTHVHATGDDHRVTPLELLFDLVFVYAITNVTGLMEHDIGGRTVLQGMITLAVVWFGWCSYTWLGNQARADEGLLRVAMVIALTGMFFVAVSIPYAFSGDGNAAVVLVVAYAVVRLTHIGVYLVAAGDDRDLRSVISSMGVIVSAVLAVLLAGALIGGEAQQWWWLGAVAIDQIGVYFVRSTRWRLRSASHFAERFGLITIIAIGESVVAIGTATSSPALGARDGLALVCGVAVAVCLWWLYFDVVAIVAEGVLHRAEGLARARLARDSYTYLHFPMVAGIVFTAMGLVLLISDPDHVDAGRYALYGGIACYLAGHLAFRLRNIGSLNVARATTAGLLLLGIPTLGRMAPLAQLFVAATMLVALVGYEVRHFRQWRTDIRSGRQATPLVSGPRR